MAISMDSISKLPASKKLLILLGFVVVILGLYGYLLYLPQQAVLKDLRLELGKLNKELEEGEAVRRDLAKFQKEKEGLERRLTLALAQLPNKKEIPSLLRNISSPVQAEARRARRGRTRSAGRRKIRPGEIRPGETRETPGILCPCAPGVNHVGELS
jgi:Tfp pilus assembly protein PilO